MKRFLYLRIVTIISLVLSISCMILIVFNWSKWNFKMEWYKFLLDESPVVPFCLHGITLIFIYQKFYPDKELPKGIVLFFNIVSIICLILLGLLLFSILWVIYMKISTVRNTVLLVLVFVVILLQVIQIIGGRHMIKTIRQNVRKQLENSFT